MDEKLDAKKKTNLRTEIMAGITTFLTMAYIIFANRDILADAGMDQKALIAVTCLASAAATLLVGIIANAPIAMAPGMGLNAIFTYTLVRGDGLPWQTALGVVFLSGLVFLILTFLGLRRRLVEAIPISLVSAMAVGIGLFITFIGLQKLGLVIDHEETLVQPGPITRTVLIGLAGFAVMVFLEVKKIRGSLLIGIIFATIIAVVFRQVDRPDTLVSLDLNIAPVAFKLNIRDALKFSLLGSIFTLMFIDMFDSIGTLVACCHQAGMVDKKNQIKGLDRLLSIDAIATMFGAVLGTSTTTSYIESAAGIEQGGRSGITSIVTGILFLLALPFVPLVETVPQYATAPALIMVGLFMMKEVRNIDFAKIDEAFAAFIIIAMIAFSYSISNGLVFGFISFAVIKIITGKARELKPAMWVIAVLSLVFLASDQLTALINHIIK